ncbi:hypothetical protein J2X46_002331 [Nocardioides sp. BE266]|uniref:FlgD immunoglobulin-like domain containing protein n=1 Tax=Nocardioides sp. BE266 TaxID=2817725 RepID=UPI002865CA88|nr:FlgD immunoglobulin-like domain containing protein [Nocardioides sp. BE266]MDR7253346.1 hypothetical protein [Nocardioides sp. BE266]
MVRRLVQAVVALGLLAPALVAVAPTANATPGDLTVHVPRAFSPNGDGRKDEAKVTYDLPETGTVKVVVMQGIPGETVAVAKLGRQGRGSHEWRWDGRGKGGAKVADGSYYVNVTLTTADGTTVKPYRRPRTRVDTVFSGGVWPRTDWSLREGKALPVYPRTSVVRDAVSLRPLVQEKARWADLVIKDARGRTVLSQDVTDARDATYTNADYGKEHPDDVVWTARLHGKPLPAGRYRAFIRGRDSVGNTNRTPAYPLWVSREALEWREATRVVTASESRTPVCGFLSTANGCGEEPQPCGQVVPSTLLTGGLSYRSAQCAPGANGRSEAWSLHYLPVPETAGVRGVGSAKVAFAGRPTADGDTDQGTLSVWREDFSLPDVDVTGSTAAETPWVDCPRGCRGIDAYDESYDPGVIWSFMTTGTDSVDIGTFTVTVRYLAVPGS